MKVVNYQHWKPLELASPKVHNLYRYLQQQEIHQTEHFLTYEGLLNSTTRSVKLKLALETLSLCPTWVSSEGSSGEDGPR